MSLDELESAADEESASVSAPSDDVMFLGQRLEQLRAEMDELDAKKKALTADYDLIRKTRLPDAMRVAGMVRNEKGSFTLASGAKVSLRTDLHVGVKTEDKNKLFAWLREEGDESLISETVHPQTLKAHCKSLVKDGRALPQFITQFNETAAVITGGRNRKEQSA